jgi:uncharacterized delta-60 repeat protein
MAAHDAGLALAVLLAILLAPTIAQAAKPGDLDRSFSRNGKVTTSFGALDGVNSVAIDAQGRIVAGGYVYHANDDVYQFALARYKADGELDRSFSADGRVGTNFVPYGGAVKEVAIDAEGRIVAAGDDYPQGFAVARFKRDGRLDRSFSGDGRATTAFGARVEQVGSMAIDSEGRIVIAGTALDLPPATGWQSFFTLVRYRPDGSLDGSFGDGGTVMDSGSPFDEARSVAIDSAGRIVVAGRTAIGHGGGRYTGAVGLARYDSSGALDPSFGTGGRVTTGLWADGAEANSLAIDSDGRMVVAGPRDPGGRPGWGLARYNPGGPLDASFSQNGRITTRFGEARAVPYSVAIDSRGRIAAAGVARGEFALARYRPAGRLDPSFSGNGKVRTQFRGGTSGAQSIAIDSRDRIVAAGGNGNFALARYIGHRQGR